MLLGIVLDVELHRADAFGTVALARVVRSTNLTGSIVNSSNPLRIGGNSLWGEWFNGVIDELRIYNRVPGYLPDGMYYSSFFTGAYAPAISHTERALALADSTGDDELRIYARRATCLVFGNVGENSGTGVAFTRDASTGDHKYLAEYLTQAQGEDVVSGARTPLSLDELKRRMGK